MEEVAVGVGVMLPNWVGDLVMATPALRTLREHLPEARILGIARPYLRSLLDGTPWLNAIVPWEHRGRGRMIQTGRLVNQLRAERLDLLILLRASFSAAAVGRLSGARRVAGFAPRGLGWLITNAICRLHSGRKTAPVSAVDEYLHVMQQLGYEARSRRLELASTAANETAADGVWKRLALPHPDRVMLLNSGGAYGEAKR